MYFTKRVYFLIQSVAKFSKAEEILRSEINDVAVVGETRHRLAAETAEKAQLITALLPAAQDAASYDLCVLVLLLIT